MPCFFTRIAPIIPVANIKKTVEKKPNIPCISNNKINSTAGIPTKIRIKLRKCIKPMSLAYLQKFEY